MKEASNDGNRLNEHDYERGKIDSSGNALLLSG